MVDKYCIISWNVDGYNDVIHQWIKDFLSLNKPDIIFLSETKKSTAVLETYFNEITDYNFVINSHDPHRYHGVVFLINKSRKFVINSCSLNIPVRKDTKNGIPTSGRVLSITLDDTYIIVGSYTPNSGISKDMDHKLPYRVEVWDPAFQSLLRNYKNIMPTIWIGDINVAPHDIDVSNPKTMCKKGGFTPLERHSFNNFIIDGEWIDVWRHQHPDSVEFSWRGHTPKPGFGMRLDNIVASNNALPYLLHSFMIHDCIPSSDHVPVGAYFLKY